VSVPQECVGGYIIASTDTVGIYVLLSAISIARKIAPS